tara:strand:- start:2960 stop:3355 length:396 start_codon:yes stop_codon:yes gene_type:complete
MDIIQKKCTPISKVELQEMKKKVEEEERWIIISNIVVFLYEDVIKFSKTTNLTTFKFSVQDHQWCGDNKFINDNKEDIISILQDIFVGCDIQINTFTKADNGTMCDVSNMDKKTLSLFNKYNESIIVINWG